MRLAAIVLVLVVGAGSARAGDPKPEIVTLAVQPAIVLPVKTSPAGLGAAITAAVMQLVAAADANTLQIAGPPFARYLTRGKQIDVEVGVPVRKAPAKKKLGKNVKAGELPAGRAVILVVRGKHEDLPKAHATLDAWLQDHDEKASGARWEVYVTNPITTPDPAAQETKIVVPLAAQ